MLKKFFAVALIAAAQISEAQVRVVDSSPQRSGAGVAQPSYNAAVETDVYSKISAMQDEITNLRGLVEEQAHEIKQLKQLQLDNYMDLDRRLSDARSSTTVIQDVSSVAPPVAVEAVVDDSIDEADLYKKAYDLLNQRNYDASAATFNSYLARFPSGTYASNSYYWMGKVAMLKRDYPLAKQWFSGLIEKFPASPKVFDAKLDLGRVYFLMGDRASAKTILTEVAASNADASRLAKKFLAENF